eukprot:TRINITY_DN43761_c0_g1_i1.p1 TRINITY_DN43761_c0_g1~~TRINITY_DN43761_c0_g1_i1.p1  ORF type:complete len:563 (-),score=108.59 TRINITY_DN43761_c0_g1_i1:108-1727(-)
MAAEQLAAITGMPSSEAAQFLEMAGGDVETAVSLYFEMGGAAGGDGGGGGGDGGFGGGAAVPMVVSTPAQAVLFGNEAPPTSWTEQGFEFSTDPASACGLIQHKNGPCGVLAAVNAVMIAQAGCCLPTFSFDDDALARALAIVLVRCATAPTGGSDAEAPASSARVIIANSNGDEPEIELPADVAAVAAHLLSNVGMFRRAGGVNTFCMSAVLTRGVDRVTEEACMDGGNPPLISGPHALCTTELLTLLLTGIARGNVSAYGSDGAKVSWRPQSDVGILSRDEVDVGVPLADQLKGPEKPIFVVHGGDHFTILWAPAAWPPTDGYVDMVHWNGLPPNRALARLRLRNASMEPPPPAPAVRVQAHWRIKVGEVESIVQARPEDKKERPGCWRTHAYELALATQAVVDEDKSEERPEGVVQPPRFEQGDAPADGAAWRCASCYQSRFKTMCFGENGAPAGKNCRFCGLAQTDAGWTIWRAYNDLPTSTQKRIDRVSGPKILTVLRTRWPDAEMSLIDGSTGQEAVPGSEGFDPTAFVSPVA